tara:strand:- start:11507 stop:11710 length:204 start_codon:yes stop_codon:yes gene_type:complete
MNKEHRAYNLGDLVEFYYNHQNVSRTLTGIVIEQKDSQYKIKVNKKDYWRPADNLVLLSQAVKAPSK